MNCLLYPFTAELEAVIQTLPYYNHALTVKEIVGLPAWKNVKCPSMEVSFDFEASLSEVEGVIIADTPHNSFMGRDLIKKMTAALTQKKHVFCFTPLQSEEIDVLSSLATKNGVRFDYKVPDGKMPDFLRVFEPQECIIIAVGGLLKEIDTFSTILHLAHRYRSLGYSVTVVSDNGNAGLFGFVPFPKKVFSENHSYGAIIHYLNSFYNRLQLKYQPDIILTQIPGGMMKYSNACLEDCGVEAYMLSQALSMDYLILNIPVDNFLHLESYRTMSDVFARRFGCAIQAIGVVNKQVNSASAEMQVIQYNTVHADTVTKYIKQLNAKAEDDFVIFDALHVNDFDYLVKKSITLLS